MSPLSRTALTLMICLPLSAAACTLWGVTGSQAPMTLIAKNRDWRPDHQQSLRLVKPVHGLPYVGLFADGGRAPGLKAGVNRAGLVVVSASASSLTRAQRDASSGEQGVMRRILAQDADLDAVEQHAAQWFAHARPMFLLLADRHGLMQVEIGLNGRYALSRQRDGSMAHTNHYFDPALVDGAQRIGQSSRVRLARVRSLIAGHQGPWAIADFQRISHDQHDGPDDSLWRHGREDTLAGWQVALPAQAAPQLWLRLANPGAPVRDLQLTLDEAFWRQAAQTLAGAAGR
ncbi:carcinine hydrolase/isopenicillin-N N-acyltransferase family protein [Paludibacterium sp. B53371]|uniref:carcinine hydrolase/isopenicillin-N N-acyltransferase family protein n=1 Tax=Paludibacterium sp. B53371 TaxID=2806263 RepID=UPI001C05E27C|nr:carcinine hydrolase/isopenicillin-N N-acyltransferase family protein [Paludibacterium sp. B53371]